MSRSGQNAEGPERAVARGLMRMGHHFRRNCQRPACGKERVPWKGEARSQTRVCRGKGAAMSQLGGEGSGSPRSADRGHRGDGGARALGGGGGGLRCTGSRPRSKCRVWVTAQSSRFRSAEEGPGLRLEGVVEKGALTMGAKRHGQGPGAR